MQKSSHHNTIKLLKSSRSDIKLCQSIVSNTILITNRKIDHKARIRMVMRAFFFLEIWKDYIKRYSTIHSSKWYNMQRSNAIEFLRTWPSDDDIKEVIRIGYDEAIALANYQLNFSSRFLTMKLLQTIIQIIDNEDDQDQNSGNNEVSRLLLDEIMMLSRPDLSSPMILYSLRIDSKIPKTNVP
ncbi:unnamed protein product [Rhizophagus irregularis]|nr:unnamed protein product [Rhizophagus irregularis]